MDNLKELIDLFQKDLIDFELVYLNFKDKINYLCYSFNIDNYKNDLLVFLWKITSNIDLTNFKSDICLYSYISKSLKRYCISLYHKEVNNEKIIYSSQMTNIEIDKTSYYSILDNSSFVFESLISNLSKKQRLIIILRYEYCFSDNEIAKELKISRQAVYKIRILALKNLRNELLDLKGGIA